MPLKLYENRIISSLNRLDQVIKKLKDNKKTTAKLLLQSILSQLPKYSNALYLYSIILKDSHPQKSNKYKNLAYQRNNDYYDYLNNNYEQILKSIQKNVAALNNNNNNIKDIHKITGGKWNNLINNFVRDKDYQTGELLSHVFQSLEKSQDFCSAQDWASLGLTDFAQGRYEQSIKKHLIAASLKPGESRFHNNLATLTYLIGDFTQSLSHIEKTMQLRPNRQKSLYLKSYVRSKQGFKTEALQLIEQAFSFHPTTSAYKTKLVIELLNFPKQFNRAKNMLNAIIQNMKGSYYVTTTATKQINILNFILEMIDSDPEGTTIINNENWIKYLELYNDYGLAGAKHKLKIEKQIDLLQNQLKNTYLKIKDVINEVKLLQVANNYST